MLSLLRKNLGLWGYGKCIALFIGCLIFSISERVNGCLTYEQHLLSATADHYYLMFLAVPIILFSSFSFIEDDSLQVILRFNSYRAYFLKKWAGVGLIAVILVIAQTSAVLLSGVGLHLSNVWNLPTGSIIDAELFSVLKSYFTNPLQAFGAFTLYQIFGSWLIFGICIWLGHFAGRKWTIRILAAVYVLAVLWLKLQIIRELPLTGLNHFLILHHNFGDSQRLINTMITAMVFIAFMLVSVSVGWNRNLPRFEIHGSGIIGYYSRKLMTPRNLTILSGIVSIVMIYKWLESGTAESSAEWIINLFSGHGTGYFQVLPFLEMLISNGAPLYLLAVFMEQALKGQSIFISIRAKSRRELLGANLSVSIEFLIVYACFFSAAGLLGTIFFSPGLTADSLKLLLYAVSLKCCDIFLQYLIMLGVYIVTKKITFGFLVVMAGNLICVLPGNWTAYSPIGLSSLARISIVEPSIGINSTVGFGIEFSLIILMSAVIWVFGQKKLLD